MENNNKSFIHQPHDKLVKRMLSRPATARDILSLYLPPEILSVVDLNKLELQPNSFIDTEHRASAVDLLYKTSFQNEEGYIWILLEHQSKSEYWMPVRVFKYMAVIWDHIRQTSKLKKLPLIYPLIIYNGDRKYQHSLNLSELIHPESSKEIFSTLFTKPFQLIDLSIIPDEELKQAAKDKILGISLLMTIKHAHDQSLRTWFEESLVHVLQKMDIAGDSDEVTDILFYLLDLAPIGDKEQILITFKKSRFSKKVEDKMTTLAEYLTEKGKKEGKKEGRLEVMSELLAILKTSNLNKHSELIKSLQRIQGFPVDILEQELLKS